MSRRRKAQATQLAHHTAEMARETSDRGRLRAACLWLVAEAIRHGQLQQVILVILDLTYRLRKRLPLPEPARGSDARRIFDAVYEQRPVHGTTPDRRDAAA